MTKEKGFLRLFFAWLWGAIKRHPIVTLVVVVAFTSFSLWFSYEIMHVTSEPRFCSVCHDQEGSGPWTEFYTYNKGVHAFNDVKCLDCHTTKPGFFGYFRAKIGGLYDTWMELTHSHESNTAILAAVHESPDLKAELVGTNVCMHCHTDSVYQENIDKHWMSFAGVEMRLLDEMSNPEFRELRNMIDIENDPVKAGVEPQHGLHTAMDVTCAQCHVSVAHSGEFIGNTDMQSCFTCHDKQREAGGAPVENDDCITCHVTQENLQAGTATAELGIEGYEWYMKSLTCGGCHADAFDIPTKQSCVDCHEEGYDTMMVDWQTAFDEQKAVAMEFIKENIPMQASMTPMKLEMFHKYREIFDLMDKDGSRGVHNPDYVAEVMNELDNMRRAFNSLPNS